LTQALTFDGGSAFRLCRQFTSDDVDETRERISRLMQPHSLEPLGRSHRAPADMYFQRLVGTGFGTIKFGEMRLDVPPLADYYLIVFCLSGHASVEFGGEAMTIDQWHGAVCGPGQRFQGNFSPDCEQFVMRIDQRAMRAHTGARRLTLAPRLDLADPALRPWLLQLQILVNEPHALRLVQQDRGAAADYEQVLLRTLLAGHAHSDAAERARGGVSPASVRRAEEFIQTHAAEPIQLRDIAAAAGVSTRSLLDSFRRFRDTSPMRHLREVRLSRTRDHLLNRQDGLGIAAIALEHGFNHLGRFAQDYQERYGERPSQTRRTPPSRAKIG